MTNYADETFYKNKFLSGRKAVVDTAFAYFARVATQEIKRFTGQNVNEYDIPEEVSMCCCEIAEMIFRQDQSSQNEGVSSESVQGWSKSYESTESRKQTFDTAVRECVYKWLNGTGLLYRGLR